MSLIINEYLEKYDDYTRKPELEDISIFKPKLMSVWLLLRSHSPDYGKIEELLDEVAVLMLNKMERQNPLLARGEGNKYEQLVTYGNSIIHSNDETTIDFILILYQELEGVRSSVGG